MLDRERLGMLRLTFDQIKQVFDEIKKQLFASERLREETELIFWVKEKGQTDYEAAYVFRRKTKGYGCEQCEAQSSFQALKDAAGKKYQCHNVSMSDDCQVEIRVFYQSPCFGENRGRLLLNTILDVFNKEIDSFLDSLVLIKWEMDEAGREMAGIWLRDLPGEVIDGAVRKFRYVLENCYEPVKLDYINRLSEEQHEEPADSLRLIFMAEIGPDADSLELVYDFRTREYAGIRTGFCAENIGQIGELLRMAEGGQYLVFDVCSELNIYQVSGICGQQQIRRMMWYDGGTIPCIVVEIRGQAWWELCLGDVYAFSYKNGQYIIEVCPDG